MTRFPWARAMELGLGQLRLPPDAFWRMTLRELSAAAKGAGAGASGEGMTRASLSSLAQRFPD
ncbi:MAG: phage tail assembly chaperone [Parvibaculum sp.]|nr:phage tail assembly chaperone [Parvibaculum sp.]